MSDLTQLITDPALCAQLQTLDPHQFIGVAGAPLVERFVQYFKEQWGVSTSLAPLLSLTFGVLLNVGLASWLGLSLSDAATIGLATGFVASGWHVINH